MPQTERREEVKEQTASEDYDCGFVDCDVPIPEGTRYVRVSEVAQKGRRGGQPSAVGMVWKFHPSCWAEDNA